MHIDPKLMVSASQSTKQYAGKEEHFDNPIVYSSAEMNNGILNSSQWSLNINPVLSLRVAPLNQPKQLDKNPSTQVIMASGEDEENEDDLLSYSASRNPKAVSLMKSISKKKKSKRTHKLQCPRRDCTTKFIHMNSLLAHLELHEAQDKMSTAADDCS